MTIEINPGDLVEIGKPMSGPGFTILDQTGKRHYFYYTSDGRFATYDGYAESVNEKEKPE